MATLVSIVNPIVMQIIIDRVLILKEYHLLRFIVTILIFFFVFGIMLQYIIGFLNIYVSQNITKALRNKLISSYLEADFNNIQKMSVGNFVSRMTEDAAIISNFVSSSLFEMLSDMLNILVTVGLMVYFSGKLTLIAVIIATLQIFISIKFTKNVRYNQEKSRELSDSHLSFLKNVFNCIRFIKIYNRYEHGKKNYEKLQKEIITVGFERFSIYFRYETCLNIISFLGSLCLMGLGIYEIYKGRMTVGALFVFDSISEKFYIFSKSIINLNVNIQKVFVSIERLDNIINLPKEQLVGEEINTDGNANITLDNVSFNHEIDDKNYQNIFENLSIVFEKGKSYVIVGASGIGKTTLFNILTRLYKQNEGDIRIGSYDVKNVSVDSIRNKITYVFQEPFVFRGTLRENIVLDRLDMTDEDLLVIIKICYLEELIENDPLFLDREIKDNGDNLSLGQKQRICIARALARNTEYFLFDEIFASLDKNLERKIFFNIMEYLKDKTKVFITHNPEIMKEFDNILFMREGNVIDFGNHYELMERCQFYKELHTAGEKSYGY